MKLQEFYEHGQAMTERGNNLWQILCMDPQGLDWVRDTEFEVLEAMRVDTWDSELRADLDEVIAWAKAFNERVGA